MLCEIDASFVLPDRRAPWLCGSRRSTAIIAGRAWTWGAAVFGTVAAHVSSDEAAGQGGAEMLHRRTLPASARSGHKVLNDVAQMRGLMERRAVPGRSTWDLKPRAGWFRIESSGRLQALATRLGGGDAFSCRPANTGRRA